MSTKVAVLLSGCGVYDGTEIHESSAVLTHLSRHGALASCFAPDKVCHTPAVFSHEQMYLNVIIASQACYIFVSAKQNILQPHSPSLSQDQMHVVDHTAGTEMSETRNVLKESARIARGKISALTELNVGDFDALIVPGKAQ